MKHGILIVLFVSMAAVALGQMSAKEVMKKVDDKMQGMSNQSTMTMSIVRPRYTRTIGFKNWSLDREYFMTYITSPAKDKGQVFLKIESEMWNFMPSINRMVKLPPSMMSQGWMGSDYTNDDMVKQSSIVVDYDQSFLEEEEIDGRLCYKVQMIPHMEANVVWGKVVYWVDKEKFIIPKGEFYDDEGELVRTEYGYSPKLFDGRELFSQLEIVPADEEENKTVMTIETMEFDVDLKPSFFSQQNMKRVK